MTRVRRDPRAERAACALVGGDRPRLARGLPAATRRPRRDPRQDLTAQRVASPLRLRLDRTQRIGLGVVVAAPKSKIETEQTPRLITIEDPAFLVAVVPDAPGGRLTVHDRQLFGAARTLAGKMGAVIALVAAGCDDLGAVGADRTGLLINHALGDTYDPDGLAVAVASAFRALAPRHLLFAETADGGDLARRVSCLVDEPLFADVEVVTATIVSRPSRGRRVEQRCAPPRLISVAPGAAAPYTGAPREGRSQTWPHDKSPRNPTAILEAVHRPADPARIPLALADFVTSAGNGVTDLVTFRRLVAALAATPGASRVLCDAGLMPRETQVGASGTVLAATCYFALGIAGAPQHLQGVAGCEHVVAVNTDLHAAMIERAGLAIVQDAQRVMPALLGALAREAESRS